MKNYAVLHLNMAPPSHPDSFVEDEVAVDIRTGRFAENRDAVLPIFVADEVDTAGRYTVIATVQADSLDEVFTLTNTIEAPWFEAVTPKAEKGVEWADGKLRSTSIGDVIIEGYDQGADRRFFVVCSMGFTAILPKFQEGVRS